MKLKSLVDKALKEQQRSLSWLAGEMDKTFDGLKLSLVKGSLKYTDIIKMAESLNLPASYFFEEEAVPENMAEEEAVEYQGIKSELKSCKELNAALKSQLADKDRIIELLSEKH